MLPYSPGMTPLTLGYAAAYRAAPRDPDLDDLAQEAAIEVARVAEKRPDAPTEYLGGVARMRVRHVLDASRRWTGQPKRQAQALDPLRRKDTAGLGALLTEPAAPDETDAAEWSVLGVDVAAALAALTPPQRASAVGVAHGMTWAEIGRQRGVSPQSAREAWVGARAHLRKSLSHLEGAF